MKNNQLLFYQLSDNTTAFTTTREGGCSIGSYASFNINLYCGDDPTHILQNREAFCQLLHIPSSRLIMPHQTHSTATAVIDESFLQLSPTLQQQALEGVDALTTDLSHTAIAISTADCVPILIYDPRHHAAAAIHAGWRGTVQRIATATLHMMNQRYGTSPADCRAVIGPSISLESFEVGEEVYQAFADAGFDMSTISRRYPATDNPLTQKPHIDLWECNRQQLIQQGVPAANTHIAGICTYKEHHRFFSARRLGIKSGRLLTGIILH